MTRFYKQSVYDPAKDKIGTVDDVIVNDLGQISGLIIGVGGFLGVGEKDVAVAFNAVHAEMKDGAWYLTIDTTKDVLKSAPGLRFDKRRRPGFPRPDKGCTNDHADDGRVPCSRLVCSREARSQPHPIPLSA